VVTAQGEPCPVTYGYAVLRHRRAPFAKSVVKIEDEGDIG